MEVAEVLERAADLIEVNGLAKMVLKDNEGRYCSIGAIGSVLGVPLTHDAWGYLDASPEEEEKVREVATALAATLPYCCELMHSSWNSIVLWNNNIDRTEAEVVEAFRQAAKELRNEAVSA